MVDEVAYATLDHWKNVLYSICLWGACSKSLRVSCTENAAKSAALSCEYLLSLVQYTCQILHLILAIGPRRYCNIYLLAYLLVSDLSSVRSCKQNFELFVDIDEVLVTRSSLSEIDFTTASRFNIQLRPAFYRHSDWSWIKPFAHVVTLVKDFHPVLLYDKSSIKYECLCLANL